MKIKGDPSQVIVSFMTSFNIAGCMRMEIHWLRISL